MGLTNRVSRERRPTVFTAERAREIATTDPLEDFVEVVLDAIWGKALKQQTRVTLYLFGREVELGQRAVGRLTELGYLATVHKGTDSDYAELTVEW